MKRLPQFLVPLFLVAVLTAGCSMPPPYVYRVNEFDRTASDFNTPLDPRDGVVVCYNSDSTTPRDVAALAREACGKEAKQLTFVGHVYDRCPALLVSGARYLCGVPQPVARPWTAGANPAAAQSPGGPAPLLDENGLPATPSAIYHMHYKSPVP